MVQTSSVGETGMIQNLRVGETGVGKTGVGETGVGEMGLPLRDYIVLCRI